ncbi:MAG TPA: 16S rRNA (adenine(1518)-N(6)/adenine(1519)-N(6))-dimethyltransferase RsmA [Candidatus Bathyarchaeia archaeon]|nr:16S rRNA (adenine(1518)-N(6)/adenine(1519)-N(6))-dimethyltransferase RsmA [Candidatus Bathyarchaeia archaeon]
MAQKRPEHHPVKRLGQNFLADRRIAEDIVASASLSKRDTVLEPGPGEGALTRLLLEKAARVIAVEKDRNLASRLKNSLGEFHNLEMIEGDVLEVELPEFNKVVSTPPYYLSSKLIIFLAKIEFDLASIVLQKEFGERLSAKPGSSDYGRISIISNRQFGVEILQQIPRTAFHPRPKVDSVLVRLSKKPPTQGVDEGFFEDLVRGIFTQRKRLAKSALAHFLSLRFGRETALEALKEVTVPDARVFQLSIAQLENLSIRLYTLIYKAGGARPSTS